MKKIISLAFLVIKLFPAYSQQEIIVLPDSLQQGLFQDFVGLRFIAEDYGLHSNGQNMQFRYTSVNNGLVMSHSMDVKGLNNSPNIGLGIEESIGKHLFINFFDVTIGYIQNTLNWNASAGIGYYLSLNTKKNLLLRGYLSIMYENISYDVGSYTDTTLTGILVNDVNIGTFVNNVKYINNLLCVTPSVELLYRRENWDFFLGLAYNYTVFSEERIDFYRTSISLNQGLYDNSNNPVNKGAIMPGSYIIKIGLIKEFGL
jgi:hypothetical protein